MNIQEIYRLRESVAQAEVELERTQLNLGEFSRKFVTVAQQYADAKAEMKEWRMAASQAEEILEEAQAELKRAEQRERKTEAELASDAIFEARKQGLNHIKIQCTGESPTLAVEACLREIKSGERISISFPKEYTHLLNGRLNLECLDELIAEFNCPYEFDDEVVIPMPKDVFFALRYEDDAIVCDFYRL